MTAQQWRNAAARAAVWAVFFVAWLRLQKPGGAGLGAMRLGVWGAIGAALIVAGIAVLAWSILTLAGAVAADTGLTATLIDGGPYRYSRNPLYLSAAAVCIGIYFLYSPFSIRDIGIAAALAGLVQWAVVKVEEPATSRRIGPAFDRYKQDVPRWLPGPWSH